MKKIIFARTRSSLLSMTWGHGLFLVFCVCFISALLSMTMMLRTEEGLMKGVEIIKGKDALISDANRALLGLTQPDDVDSADQDFAAILQQAEQISAALNPNSLPFIDWMYRLENERVADRDLTVFVRPWTELTQRQKNLFASQGVALRPWPDDHQPPERIDNFEDRSQFWIEKTHKKQWIVHAVMADMMATQTNKGYQISDLDLIRIILWSDELIHERAWVEQNPPPLPPEEARASRVGVQIIPSTLGVVSMFWVSAGFVMLFLSISGMLFAMSSWDSMRKEGSLEAFAALPTPSFVFLQSYLGSWSIIFLGMMFISALLCSIILGFSELPIPWFDLSKVTLLIWSLTSFLMSLSVCVSVWWPYRWWKLWTFVLLIFAALSLQFFYLSFFTQGFMLAQIMSHAWLWIIICIIFVFLCWATTLAAGRRIDLDYRSGFKKY